MQIDLAALSPRDLADVKERAAEILATRQEESEVITFTQARGLLNISESKWKELKKGEVDLKGARRMTRKQLRELIAVNSLDIQL